jgi:hypothetical protein
LFVSWLMLFAAATPSQAQERDVFTQLAGCWEGRGDLFGRPAVFSMTWERRVANTWVLTFSNAFVDSTGQRTPVLQATALYGRMAGTGVWFDTRGLRLELTWTATDSLLAVEWRAPDERGRTHYRVRDDATIDVTDEVYAAEGWRRFGSAQYQRCAATRQNAASARRPTAKWHPSPPRERPPS